MDTLNRDNLSSDNGAGNGNGSRASTAPPIKFLSLGLQEYKTTWEQMKQFVAKRSTDTTDEIWLLQHPPVFTLGQAGKEAHILNPGDIPIVRSDRGGQVTYHGPGQLVAYLMIDVARRGWHSRELVRRIETALINLLASLDISAHSRQDAPGVYTEEGCKIASLGLRIKRQSSYHGLALNVDMDLSPFQRINPCGYAGMAMTHIKAHHPAATLEHVQTALIQQLQQTLNELNAGSDTSIL